MKKIKGMLNKTVCTTVALRRVMISLLAVALVVNLSPFAALPSYAENNGTSLKTANVQPEPEGLLQTASVETEGVYTVGNTGFATLQGAIDAAGDTETVVWVNGVAEESGNFTIPAGKNIVLRTQEGASLTVNGEVSVAGSLTLNDGVVITSTQSSAVDVLDGGHFTMNGGTMTTEGQTGLHVNAKGVVDLIAGGTIVGQDMGIYCNGLITKISGGEIKARNEEGGTGILAMSGSHIVEISGGDIVGGSARTTIQNRPNGRGLFAWPNSRVDKISGGTFTGGTALHLFYSSAPSESLVISGGTFVGSGKAGFAFQLEKGSQATVTGGSFSGRVGMANFGTLTGISDATINGSVYNYSTCGDIENTTINVSSGTALWNTTYSPLSVTGTIGAIKNCTISSDGSYAIENAEGATIGCISNSAVTSAEDSAVYNAGAIGFMEGVSASSENGSAVYNRGKLDKIVSGSFKGSTYGLHNAWTGSIGEISGGDFSGDTYAALNQGAITSVSGGKFQGGYYGLRNAGSVEEISGGLFKGDSGLMLWGDDNTVGKITGGVFEGNDEGIWNYNGSLGEIGGNTACSGTNGITNGGDGVIGAITGGSFSGTNDGVLNNGAISQITGGSFTGTNWFGIWNNADGASIGAISLSESTSSVFSGGLSAIGNYQAVQSIDGPGVFIGGSWSTLQNNSDSAIPLEGSLDGVVIGQGRYVDNATLLAGSWTLPAGYHMSQMTTTVNGQEGEFHFIVKDGSVAYKGNGHALEAGEGIDDETFLQASGTDIATVADNDFNTGNDFQFAENGMELKGWNTKADGSGDSYGAGDEAIIPAGGELVLYAQWEEVRYSYEVTPDGQKTEGNGPKFKKLQDAINATTAESPQVLVLQTKQETGNFTVPANKAFTVSLDVVSDPSDVSLTATSAGETFVVNGSLEIRDGINIVSEGGSNGLGVFVSSGAHFTMKGGRVECDSGAGLYVARNGGVPGTVDEISGGTIVGVEGISCPGAISLITGDAKIQGTADTGFELDGSALRLRSGGYVGLIDGGVFSVQGESAHAVLIDQNSSGRIHLISGGEFIGGDSGSGLCVGFGRAYVDEISGGAFRGNTALQVWSERTAELTISGGEFIGAPGNGSGALLYNGSVAISNAKFEGHRGLQSSAAIESIRDTTINSESVGLLNYGTIKALDATTVTSTEGRALDNEGTIVAIEGGKYTGAESALFNCAKVGTISGGTFTATAEDGVALDVNSSYKATIDAITGGMFMAEGADGVGIAVYSDSKWNKAVITSIAASEKGALNVVGGKAGVSVVGFGQVGDISSATIEGGQYGISNEGAIETIQAASEGDVVIATTGTEGSAVGNAGTVGHLIGNVVLIGKQHAVANTSEDAVLGLEDSGEFDLTAENAAKKGYVRYQTSSNTVESQLDGVTIPAGYRVSSGLSEVGGQAGLFRYLTKAYMVTFVDDDGTTVLKEATSYDYGTPAGDVVRPDVPTKASSAEYAYTFTGWNPPVSDVTEDATYVATYSNEPNIYTITFDTAGGTAIDPIVQKFGTVVTAPQSPTRDGYDFAGWDRGIPEIMPAENITVTARWTPKVFTLTYTDGVEGEAVFQDQVFEVKYQDPVPAFAGTPYRDGYEFVGWNGEIPEKMPAQNLVFAAQWHINAHTVTFDAAGGEPVPEAQTINHGDKAQKPTDPKRDGYTFEGWFYNDTAYDFTAPVMSDIELVAHWTQVVIPIVEPEPDPDPDPDPEPTPEPTPTPDPDPDPEPTPEPGSDPEPTPTPAPEPEPAPEPTPTPTPEPEPATNSDPNPADEQVVPEPNRNVGAEPQNGPTPAATTVATQSPAPSAAASPAPVTVFAPLPPLFGGEAADNANIADQPAGQEAISDGATPLAEPSPVESETIEDDSNPLAALQAPGFWSLANLLATAAAVLAVVAAAIEALRRRKREETEQGDRANDDGRARRTLRIPLIVAVVVAGVSVVGLLLTQDFTQQMAIFDAWSPLFIAAAVVNVALAVMGWRRGKGHDDGGNAAEPISAAA